MNDAQAREKFGLERLFLFSDAVFAIAITLLAIEIRLPGPTAGSAEPDLASQLLLLIPRIIGFLFSFFLIGQTWIEHHRMGGFITAYRLGLLWWNLLVLCFVVMMPFVTSVLSEHDSRSAVILYASAFTGLGLAKAAFWRYAVRHGLTAGADPEAASISRRVWATPLTAGLVVAAAAMDIPHAYYGFMLIPLAAYLLQKSQPAAAAGRRHKNS